MEPADPPAQLPELLELIKEYTPSRKPVEEGKRPTPPTWNTFDFFSKLFLVTLTRLEGVKYADLHNFYECFLKFRDIALSHFLTSSEEKGTLDAYHSKIFQREAKAKKDLKTLEHQLHVERLKRAKVFSQLQVTEQHLHKEEELVKEEALEAEHQLEAEFHVLEEHESKIFQEEESDLLAKCQELKTVLNQLQVENREAELSLRDKKEQSSEEVTNLLKEYAEDIKTRNDELRKLHEGHINIQAKLDKYQNYFKEKELAELRKKEEEQLKEQAREARKKRREDAVVFIQFVWRRYRKKKKALAKLQEKDKKKGKGKRKDGSKSKQKSKGSKKSKGRVPNKQKKKA